MLKRCTNSKCEQPMKDTGQFQKARGSKDGLQHWCKACISVSNKKSYQSNREAVLIRQSKRQKTKSAQNAIRKAAYQQEMVDKGLKRCSCPKCEHPIKNIGEFCRDRGRKDGLNVYCRSCQSKIGKAKHSKYLERSTQYRLDNRDKINHQKKEHYRKNANSINQRQKEWNGKNADKLAARNARRHAAKLQRTTGWANLKKIAELYWVAKTLTSRTGIKWVVDHVIPLQGVNVSGLHVENNLQVNSFKEFC